MEKMLSIVILGLISTSVIAEYQFQIKIIQPSKIKPYSVDIDLGGSQSASSIVMGGDGDYTIYLTPGTLDDIPYEINELADYNIYGHRTSTGSVRDEVVIYNSRSIELKGMYLDNRGDLSLSLADGGVPLDFSDPFFTNMSIKINNEVIFISNTSTGRSGVRVWNPVSQEIVDAFTSNEEFTIDFFVD